MIYKIRLILWRMGLCSRPPYEPGTHGHEGDHLDKLQFDSFPVLLMLSNGKQIQVMSATEIRPGWLYVEDSDYVGAVYGDESDDKVEDATNHTCPRGILIQISQIVLIADAPDGS